MTDSSHRLRFGVYPPGFNQIKLINKLDKELKLVRRGGREHQPFGDWPWLPIAASLLNPNLVHFPQEERGSVFNKKPRKKNAILGTTYTMWSVCLAWHAGMTSTEGSLPEGTHSPQPHRTSHLIWEHKPHPGLEHSLGAGLGCGHFLAWL